MPARNRVKQFIEGGYYHVYNRGVEKRMIFLDDHDYHTFLYLLKYYLTPPKLDANHPLTEIPGVRLIRPRPLANVYNEVKLVAYCLLPNHFHLLLQQLTQSGMTKLMRGLTTCYAMYFNRKYGRVGSLFQDIYKAAWVGEGNKGDQYLLHLTRYIHLNPKFEMTGINPVNWPHSSYAHYLGQKTASWIHPEPVLAYFAPNKSSSQQVVAAYRRFVEESQEDLLNIIGKLMIE
jgi:putative transposase